ncbi:MAG: phage holin family protein [Myxococcales bacterium]|nr:phage holin family protein [Myxococcales bacterium]
MAFVSRWFVTTLAVLAAVYIVPGIHSDGFAATAITALLLGLLNAFVRPILILLTLPATLLTLGLFLIVINAATLSMAAALVTGFSVSGFGSALLGAILISLVSSAISKLMATPN